MKLNIIKNGDFQGSVTPVTVTQETPSTAVTVDASLGVITLAAHGFTLNTPVVFTGTTPPGGLSFNTIYFVTNATTNTFQVSATLSGSAIEIYSAGVSVAVSSPSTAVTATPPAILITLAAHGLALNATVMFSGTTAPTGLTFGTTYFVSAPTTNTFKVSATASGAAILYTNAGTAVSLDFPLVACTASSVTSLITKAAHGLTLNTPIVFGGTAVPAGLVAGTTYFVTTPLTNTFGVSATLNGSAITLTSNGTSVQYATGISAIVASSDSTSFITLSAHGLSNGTPIILGGTAAPTGLTLGAEYYVVNETTNTFQLSTTATGSAIVFTSAGTSPMISSTFSAVVAMGSPALINKTSHGLTANTPVIFGAATAPVGLALGAVYFVTAPTTNSFEISETAGGPAISLGSNGVSVVMTSNPSDVAVSAALISGWVVDANVGDATLPGAVGGNTPVVTVTTSTPEATVSTLGYPLDPRINGEAVVIVKNASLSGALVHGPNTYVEVAQIIASGQKLFTNGGNTLSFFVGSSTGAGAGRIAFTVAVGTTVLFSDEVILKPGWNYVRRDLPSAPFLTGHGSKAYMIFTLDDGADVALSVNSVVAITDAKIGVIQHSQDAFSAIERAVLG